VKPDTLIQDNNKKVHFMKYTFYSLSVAALALTTTLFISPSDASAVVNQGTVTCYINQIDPDHATVSVRRFVNFVQISQETWNLQNQGYGLEKEIDLARFECINRANQLCINQLPAPTFTPLLGVTAKGSLLEATYRTRC
jgi:hypothetical protein